MHICIGAAAANDAVGIAENEERTAAHARCGIENDDHSALRSVKMQLVVFCVACQLAGDGRSVFCIDSNISYPGAADDFSSMKISVGTACYINGNSLTGSSSFPAVVSVAFSILISILPCGVSRRTSCKSCLILRYPVR